MPQGEVGRLDKRPETNHAKGVKGLGERALRHLFRDQLPGYFNTILHCLLAIDSSFGNGFVN
jgi:hypothetical protein